MILLDANVLLLDLLYVTDAYHAANRACLNEMDQRSVSRGIVYHALLEVVGKMSFNTPTARIPRLLDEIPNRYGLVVVPNPAAFRAYAEVSIDEVTAEIERKMSLGDAVQAVQIRKYAPTATALLTWNAKHFVGRLAVPVLTPAEWLNPQAPGNTP